MNTHLLPAFSLMAGLTGLAYAEYLRRTKERFTVLPSHRRPSVVCIDTGRDSANDNQKPKQAA